MDDKSTVHSMHAAIEHSPKPARALLLTARPWRALHPSPPPSLYAHSRPLPPDSAANRTGPVAAVLSQ